MKIRLLRDVRGLGKTLYVANRVVEGRLADDGYMHIVSTDYVPLNPEEWEFVGEDDED